MFLEHGEASPGASPPNTHPFNFLSFIPVLICMMLEETERCQLKRRDSGARESELKS